MASFDLKPLTKEIITKMNYSHHDLWVVKIKDEVFGPYEVESLKHYATENEKLLIDALASRADNYDWQPFYDYAVFQTIAHSEHEPEPVFWILLQGQKTGPHSKIDIEKKIELGILGLNDMISCDDGHTWQRFYQLNTFKTVQTEELPVSPTEDCLLDAHIETKGESSALGNSLAALSSLFRKQEKTTLNLDEIDLKSLEETEVSRSLKTLVFPLAACVVSFLLFVGYYFVNPSSELTEEEEVTLAIKHNKKYFKIPKRKQAITKKPAPVPQAPRPVVSNPVTPRSVPRQPASIQPTRQERSALTQPPRMDHNPYPAPPLEKDPYGHTDIGGPIDPVADDRAIEREEKEHSLVSNGNPYSENDSLDQNMSNAAHGDDLAPYPPEQPIIEEATDF